MRAFGFAGGENGIPSFLNRHDQFLRDSRDRNPHARCFAVFDGIAHGLLRNLIKLRARIFRQRRNLSLHRALAGNAEHFFDRRRQPIHHFRQVAAVGINGTEMMREIMRVTGRIARSIRKFFARPRHPCGARASTAVPARAQ